MNPLQEQELSNEFKFIMLIIASSGLDLQSDFRKRDIISDDKNNEND